MKTKSIKARSPLQQFTSTRNWQKARVMGTVFDKSVFTAREGIRVALIEEQLRLLIKDWDDNTKTLIANFKG